LIPDGGFATSIALSTIKAMFKLDRGELLYNQVIADVDKQIGNMRKCMGQQIEATQVEDHVDDMKAAFMLYELARDHRGNENDDQMDKFRDAWQKYIAVAVVKFDDDSHEPAEHFAQRLAPLQDFAQSFVLISFDYLIYLRVQDPPNYEKSFEYTLEAFESLRSFAFAARRAIFNQMKSTMNGLPCRNGADIDAEMVEWSDVFESTYVSPIDAYIEALEELNVDLAKLCPSLNTRTDDFDNARCGPLFGGKRCNQNLIGYAVYCNTDNGWCGTTNAHKNAQSDDIYDFNPVSCVKPEDIAQFSD